MENLGRKLWCWRALRTTFWFCTCKLEENFESMMEKILFQKTEKDAFSSFGAGKSHLFFALKSIDHHWFVGNRIATWLTYVSFEQEGESFRWFDRDCSSLMWKKVVRQYFPLLVVMSNRRKAVQHFGTISTHLAKVCAFNRFVFHSFIHQFSLGDYTTRHAGNSCFVFVNSLLFSNLSSLLQLVQY